MARPLLHLMQMVSPALPVGAYAYSQGLEYAVEKGWVNGRAGAEDWIGEVLSHSVGGLDLPVLLRLLKAWQQSDWGEIKHWNQTLQAARESRELLLEDVQMGQALLRLLVSLELPNALQWPQDEEVSFATVFALAAQHFEISDDDALSGFAWSWLENQAAAAIKLVPLGQTDGQRLLMALMPCVEQTVANAYLRSDDEIGAGLPGLAMASMQHETQYSRLFRS
ncbi:urease accessory protein UreF [Zhongshania aliphaticivorans]|uniref:urease accessory protein UreF n=1 Tax=Zhongshania aliphaticivorans TaxID=1470434 RepID=UPI0012E4891D|nr:urease accessory UreF family protein [Zhongshania aliphaticivorans]CAA0118272.1 Urease accessory protein UreF [Zhongshania aliphaticivorans]